jgi:hypothetical protein
MSNTLNQIATVDISIESPIVYDVSFGNLLLVGALPSDTTKTPDDFGEYASYNEVLEAGWRYTDSVKDPIAVAASVAFSQSPIPNKIYIVPQKVKTPASGGTPAVYETAAEAVTRALEFTSWYVVCPAGVADAQVTALATLIEANERMMVYSDNGFFTGGETPLVDNTMDRTVGIFGAENATQVAGEIPEANKYINVAFAAKWLYYDPGSETTAFKMLNVVKPCDLSSTNTAKLVAKNLNYYLRVGNRNVTMLGKTMSGEWADVIRFRDWLKNDMQTRVVNLFIMNPKVPYTDNGIALVQNQMIASLQRGQDMGGIARDEFDEYGNKIPAFATSVPLASSMTPSERASRRLTNCKFSARLSGAIHFAEIKGSLTYTL